LIAGGKVYMRALLAVSLLVAMGGQCNNNNSTTTTSASPTLATETDTGTVPAAVNGVPQSASNNFTVGQGGGTVTVTLTSAVETLPGGMLNSTVSMGLGVGTPSGTTCTLLPGTAPSIFQAGAAATLSGNLGTGAFCVEVLDVTVQQGPVVYTVVVIHP
jgi:hypothetical protein